MVRGRLAKGLKLRSTKRLEVVAEMSDGSFIAIGLGKVAVKPGMS